MIRKGVWEYGRPEEIMAVSVVERWITATPAQNASATRDQRCPDYIVSAHDITHSLQSA